MIVKAIAFNGPLFPAEKHLQSMFVQYFIFICVFAESEMRRSMPIYMMSEGLGLGAVIY